MPWVWASCQSCFPEKGGSRLPGRLLEALVTVTKQLGTKQLGEDGHFNSRRIASGWDEWGVLYWCQESLTNSSHSVPTFQYHWDSGEDSEWEKVGEETTGLQSNLMSLGKNPRGTRQGCTIPPLVFCSLASFQFCSPAGFQLCSPTGFQFCSPAGFQFCSPAGFQFCSPTVLAFCRPAG